MRNLLKLLIGFTSIFYLISFGKLALQMLQINLYNENNRYFRWIFKNKKEIFFKVDIIALLLSILIFFIKEEYIVNYLLMGIAFLLMISLKQFYDNILSNLQNKKPLVITARVKRLIITGGLIFSFLLYVFIFHTSPIALVLIISILYFVYFYIGLINIINYPVERLVFYYYYFKARRKLNSLSNLNVVGITGSYGKTSCKNILDNILKEKYITLASPKSINTLNGLMININNKLSKFDNVYIAEMGAFVRGEIKALCKLVRPRYGIITNIGLAHMETFKTKENIVKAKMELIESLPKGGVGVLNKDVSELVQYDLKTSAKIVWIGIENDADIIAKDIKASSNGLKFTIKTQEDSFDVETSLLGKHNIYNILSSAAIALELGMTKGEIIKAIKTLKPIEHRLEIKKLFNFTQIDDSYNSNPVGAKSALEVLSMLNGYKVVVTPGMIELGDLEEDLNYEFGKNIKEIAKPNLVILIGKNQTKPIYDGLVDSGYLKENIVIINDVRKAFEIIRGIETKEEIFALFENDLPDNYTEKGV